MSISVQRKGAAEMSSHKAVPVQYVRHPVHLLAYGFGSGLVPRGPGTAGTVVGVAVYLLLQDLALPLYLGIVSSLFLSGIWICHKVAHELGVHDHPAIVWDEIVGYLVTMISAPHGWQWVLGGCVLFRLFDIWKPWPIHLADRKLSNGFGIMLDDLLAGVMAALVLQLVAWLSSAY
jgi:phosphatidylglycerophosphatase A